MKSLRRSSVLLLIIFITCVSTNDIVKYSDDNDLIECEKYDVCNVVTFPYFGKYIVEKFCNCPNGTFCPATFSKEGDGQSLAVNVRTQMKFCTKIVDLFEELPECEMDQPALIINTKLNLTIVTSVVPKLTCKCDKNPVYWKHILRSGLPITDKLFLQSDHYECTSLSKCETNDFCGLARTDYGFVFQRCTCANYDTCRYYVEDEDIEEDIEELFYNQHFYKSKCLRNENSNFW